MNIATVPYHDWRKIEAEGSRTRDAHMMHHLSTHRDVENLIIVNRPITYTEIFLKKKRRKIDGAVVFKQGAATLYKIEDGLFVFDYISNDLLGPLFLKKKWFFKSFATDSFYQSFQRTVAALGIQVDLLFTQNIFSEAFALQFEHTVFDAWDNFLLFPENQVIHNELKAAYQNLADKASAWITNSPKNVDFYREKYQLQDCSIIKNGVDIELFNTKYQSPDDMAQLPKPIIGFGGKITHLFDYDLFNEVVTQHADKSFVIVGQILDKDVFGKIKMAPNVHYLGDKNYGIYPAYVTNFDVGIIPYVTNHLEHGADSIKVYEYIAAGLGVVGTDGAGMSDMTQYMHVAKNSKEFSGFINEALTRKMAVEIPAQHTWQYKVNQVVQLFEETMHKVI